MVSMLPLKQKWSLHFLSFVCCVLSGVLNFSIHNLVNQYCLTQAFVFVLWQFHAPCRVNLDKNLSLAKTSLTEKQKEILNLLWEKYFR